MIESQDSAPGCDVCQMASIKGRKDVVKTPTLPRSGASETYREGARLCEPIAKAGSDEPRRPLVEFAAHTVRSDSVRLSGSWIGLEVGDGHVARVLKLELINNGRRFLVSLAGCNGEVPPEQVCRAFLAQVRSVIAQLQ